MATVFLSKRSSALLKKKSEVFSSIGDSTPEKISRNRLVVRNKLLDSCFWKNNPKKWSKNKRRKTTYLLYNIKKPTF